MPMAHSELPGMFNFEELHKGWFPHVFHTRENLSYRGPMPAKDYFKPQAMMPKNGKNWYVVCCSSGEKRRIRPLKELNKYYHSDVMVLKAACEAFIKKFQEEAGFNPMEKCATIASACNHFWRRELVSEETIAIEPMNGWRGANVNQSNIALV